MVTISISNQNTQVMKVMGRYRDIKAVKKPIVMLIEVLSGEYIYKLKFSKVSRFLFDSPSEHMLVGPVGLGDWGYSELTDVEDDSSNSTLSYEVLFSSGTTLLIEFSRFSYSKERFIK